MKNSALIKTSNESLYKDIYTEYGVSFIKGSYIKLLNKSQAKEYVKNKSRLEHGTRIIRPSTKYTEKSVSLDLLLEADTMAQFVERYEAFTEHLGRGLIYLKIPSRYRIFKLVYKNITPKQEYRHKKATFTLEMIEPNPEDRIILT